MSDAAIIINVILSSCISITGMVGNMLVIIAYYKCRSLRTITNMFVLQLAVNDLMKASIILTIKSINLARRATSNGFIFCQMTGFLRTIGSCQATLLLSAIAIVRYFKVVKPNDFAKIFSLKKTLVYCGSIFLVTTLFALFPIFGVGEYQFSKSHGVCFVNWENKNFIFRCIYYLMNFGITFPVLVFCYFNIFRTIRLHSLKVASNLNHELQDLSNSNQESIQENTSNVLNKSDETVVNKVNVNEQVNINTTINEVTNQTTNTESSKLSIKGQIYRVSALISYDDEAASDNSEQPYHTDSQKVEFTEKSSNRRESKAKIEIWNNKIDKNKEILKKKREKTDLEIEITKVMFIVFAAYSICWMPAFAINIYTLFDELVITKDFLLFIPTLVDISVALNPLIYGIGSRQFRRVFLSVFRWHHQSSDDNVAMPK